ncbi:MAG: non-hydrolyzing UDP-N-acetylglucosamine 2-epimerase [Candidatus Omnitrophota bacterium]
MRQWILVAGARPNFMKIASIVHALNQHGEITPLLVHTGQHYTPEMSDIFFNQLGIPEPDMNLDVGSGSHAVQTAEIMIRFETVLLDVKPELVLVVGDVNSTLACALTAVKMKINVAHVEAGLRSFDRDMPEEINRILTDAISDFLFITEPSAEKNLLNEGIPREKIFFVGNTMIDTLIAHREKAEASHILDSLKLKERKYALVTLHRPSNVDHKEDLSGIWNALRDISTVLPIVFPAHPRTVKQMNAFDLTMTDTDRFRVVPPLGYHDFLKLMTHARCVLTDSGGIQEETSILGVPCLTLRKNTERPVTVDMGTNRIVGTDPDMIREAFMEIYHRNELKKTPIPLWDGKAAERIVSLLIDALNKRFNK